MNRTLIYKIEEKDSPCTVESFLKARGYSRQIIIQLKKNDDGITVNGRWAYVKTMLRTGDELKIFLEETQSSEHIRPVLLPLAIVWEDEDILVLNKPADMPVHPSVNNYDNTLANAVAHYYRSAGEEFIFRCINRLDRDTTGLLILARHMLSACVLSNDMLNHRIKREYRAIVCGRTMDTGTINAPIARVEGSTIERQVDFGKGESACTHYRRIAYNERLDLSLISLWLETGRTHQIRVHMKSIGHPLPGDFLYHPDYRHISRQPLHSYRLGFTHPVTGQPMEFTAGLPEDMERLL